MNETVPITYATMRCWSIQNETVWITYCTMPAASRTDNIRIIEALKKMSRKAAHRKGRPDLQGSLELDAHLMRTAAKLFIEQGYDGVSMDQIAAEAGAGKQSLYRRYVNKEALFKAVVTNHLLTQQVERWDEKMAIFTAQELVQPEHAMEALRKMARTSFDFVFEPETVSLFRLFVAEMRRFPDLGDAVRQIIETFEDELSKRIAIVEQAGLFRSEGGSHAARNLAALVNEGPLLQALLGLPSVETEAKREAYFEAAWNTFVDSMTPQQLPSPGWVAVSTTAT